MKRKGKWIGAILVAGAVWYGIDRMKVGQEAPPTAIYSAERVARRDLRVVVESTGQVEPRNRLRVTPPISGRLEELLLDEGDLVRKGQVIGWVSSTERAALLDAALAAGPEELAYWQEIYKPTPLIAPLDGTVIARNFEPGQSISAVDAVVVIADDLIVVANLDETDIGLIRPEQSVVARLEAYPEVDFACIVEKIAYDAKTVSSVTMYEVDVKPRQIPDFARSGMTAELEFVVSQQRSVLAVPVAAIEFDAVDPARATVQTGSPSAPQPRSVALGASDGTYTEVLEGLEEGEMILIPGIAPQRDTGPGGHPFMPKKAKKKE